MLPPPDTSWYLDHGISLSNQYHITFWALVPPSCDQLGTVDNILETTGVYIWTSIWTPEYSPSCQLDHCRDNIGVML